MAENKDRPPPAAWYQPNSTMTEEQLEEAFKTKINFPEVVKTRRDPPVKVKCERCSAENTQEYAAVSIMVLPEAKNGIHAFAKVRGAWCTKDSFVEHAKKIVKDVDSKFPTNCVPMGSWFPITDNAKYEAQEVLIREDLTTGKIQEDPIAKAEERHNAIIKQLREREKILRDSSAPDDPTSDKQGLPYYTMRKVTIDRMKEYIEEGEEKLAELRRKREEMIKEIGELDNSHPEYKDQWLRLYNEKRSEVGMDPYSKLA